MANILELTKKYIEAFNKKDISTIETMVNDTFVLEDPVVVRVEGKKASTEAIKNIFDNHSNLSFKARNIFIDEDTSIIEFNLKLDDKELIGSDIIEWENNKMKELRAYLDVG